MKIIVSNEARFDIRNIYEYISRNSTYYAIETTRNIRSYIRNLKQSPYLGRYVPELQDKKYLELIYKSYRIVYSVDEKTSTIYIHFIIHGKRNFKSFFDTYNNNFLS